MATGSEGNKITVSVDAVMCMRFGRRHGLLVRLRSLRRECAKGSTGKDSTGLVHVETHNEGDEMMNQCARIGIYVFGIIGKHHAISQSDGIRVFDSIAKAVRAGCGAAVLFKNITAMTPAFLNAAIGQMYGSFTDEQIAMVTFPDISIDDAALLDRVVKNAKAYFINRWEVAK